MKKIFIAIAILACCIATAAAVSSCKAWRTITTTCSCVQVNDSTENSVKITSKTVEEYQGVKRN